MFESLDMTPIVFRVAIILLFLMITTGIQRQINAQPVQSLKNDTITIGSADTTAKQEIKSDISSSTRKDRLKTKKAGRHSKIQTNDSIYIVPAYIPYNKSRDVKKYPNSNGGASEILRDVINRNRRQ